MIILLSLLGVVSSLFFKQDKVMVQTVKAGKVENNHGSSFSGKLEALETANIVSKVTGKVGVIYVDIGSEVKGGDTLLTLEANDLAASVDQAQASVATARSSLETARIDYDVQRQSFERYKVLVEQGALARADFDNKYALPFAKAKELALNGSVAQVRQAEASLQLALANYQNSIIVSPISGVIAAKNVNVGELANPEVTLFSVVNLDKVFVMTSVGEEKINQITVGGQVPVKIASVSEIPFNGTVTNIAQASGSTSKTYLVKVLIDNQDHRLKPGMFAEALWEGKIGIEVVVPKTAVISENNKNYIWTMTDGIVSKKAVLLGSADVINVIVQEGLEAGQDIVISGQELLTEGMQVAWGVKR
ncbi:cobalt-zinc-cadmium efflux system membrane fusion protein [Sporomusaceae bacterium BoRhaA]|uniref:efflux RND transporter periplasmic adaptor subunit n=1 Tax=Pelorhabdus rhamnosifermentans TaxID=2772457 RepID=UPI001C062A70|nr:efflux RND transporter periplasmic adaptor subunit [Pelorhabdus rhamnosifermentans]MBU2699836.1 cobalt-zinc-cadmium efflux system membrane fusion protein [Pelorhabdus rhamnosifermentans]